MTQFDLCKEIISVSYLSKIENGCVDPPKEVIGLLCEKLNIDPLFKGDEKEVELCKDWFKQILFKEKSAAMKGYPSIEKITNLNSNLMNIVDIHKLSYFQLIKDNERTEIQYAYLKRISTNFNDRELYYWLKYSGDYHYFKLAYNKALTLYQKAEKYLNSDIFLKKEEENYLYYLISLSASKLRKSHLSLMYANKALDYYKSVYKLRRSAQCHILIGISHRLTGELDKSKTNYELALTIADILDEKKIVARCFQNLGELYSMMGESEKAIGYYLKNYELRQEDSNSNKIIPITSLMKEYYKEGLIEDARKWLNIGLKLSKKLSTDESVYVYAFEVYNHLINGVNNSFEDLILDKVIPYLDEKQLYYEKYRYLTLLAEYYFSNRKYKAAASYYNYANNTMALLYKE